MASINKFIVLNENTISTKNSKDMNSEAWEYQPAGVQGDGRYYKPFPIYIKRAKGARIWDVDGNEYIDYHGSYGPAVLGYSDDRVNKAVKEVMDHEGVLFALPHPRELELAKIVAEVIPSGQKTIFTNSGSEAVYHSIRVARAFTERQVIIKIEGAYHGWFDDVAVSVKPDIKLAGPPKFPNSVPISQGTPNKTLENIIIIPFNNLNVLEEIVSKRKSEIAAILVEPVIHSCGCLLPEDGYLEGIKDIATTHDILLIFDGVLTSFRHHQGGVQAIYGVTPDLTAFGKAFSNGFAISGVTGRNQIMSLFSPEGGVFFSGTFNGHLLNVTAALKTQEILRDKSIYDKMWKLGKMIKENINLAIKDFGVNAYCEAFGSVWTLYFDNKNIKNYRDLIKVAYSKDDPVMRAYLSSLLNNGIYIQPFYVSRSFISASHTEDDIQKTIDVSVKFIKENKSSLK